MSLRITNAKLALFHVPSTRLSGFRRKTNLQNKLIQAHKPRLGEDQVKVLERLRHPEALTLIQLACLLPVRAHDVCDSGMRNICFGGFDNRREHAPSGILKGGVTGYSVQDEDGLNGFRAALIS
jgi:hypothetical protein